MRRTASKTPNPTANDNQIGSLEKSLLDNRNPVVQLKAIEALEKIGDERSQTVLLNALDSIEGAIRHIIIQALGNFRNQVVVQKLIDIMLKDPDPVARSNAALSLADIGDSQATAPLMDTLQRDPDIGVRRSAAEALGSFPEERVLERLLETSRTQQLNLKTSIAIALGQLACSMTRPDVLAQAIRLSAKAAALGVLAAVQSGKSDPQTTQMALTILAKHPDISHHKKLLQEINLNMRQLRSTSSTEHQKKDPGLSRE